MEKYYCEQCRLLYNKEEFVKFAGHWQIRKFELKFIWQRWKRVIRGDFFSIRSESFLRNNPKDYLKNNKDLLSVVTIGCFVLNTCYK